MAAVGDRDQMAADLAAARAAQDAALADLPQETSVKLSTAELALVRVRDRLIARRRVASSDATLSELLERVDLCLSLVVRKDYPHGSAEEPPLKQARGLIDQLLDDVSALQSTAALDTPPGHRVGDPAKGCHGRIPISRGAGSDRRLLGEGSQPTDGAVDVTGWGRWRSRGGGRCSDSDNRLLTGVRAP